MDKDSILERFKDINFMYNDCSKLDELSNCLDEYKALILQLVLEQITNQLDSRDFEEILCNVANYKYIEIY